MGLRTARCCHRSHPQGLRDPTRFDGAGDTAITEVVSARANPDIESEVAGTRLLRPGGANRAGLRHILYPRPRVKGSGDKPGEGSEIDLARQRNVAEARQPRGSRPERTISIDRFTMASTSCARPPLPHSSTAATNAPASALPATAANKSISE